MEFLRLRRIAARYPASVGPLFRSTIIEDLHQAIDRRTNAFKRQLLTETQFQDGVFLLFVNALVDDPQATARVTAEFGRLDDLTKSHFESMLKRLPCEGDFWDWPPGGMLVNPGGCVAWQTPIPAVQDAIASLRRCVTDHWSACGQFRDVAPGGPFKNERVQRTKKDLRPALVLWAKGILGPEAVLGLVIDCFNEHEMAQDWNLCEACDRERIHRLLATYQPSEIPMGIPGPPDREWQAQRDRKYLVLLRLLGLQPSIEWARAHQ